MEFVLEALTVLEHILLVAVDDGRLPEVGQILLDVCLEITGRLPTDVGALLLDLVGKRNGQSRAAADIGEIGVPEIHFDVGEHILHRVEGLHHKGLRGGDPVIHLVKFEELAEEEKILVAENSPVGGKETQTDIFLATDLIVALEEHLGFLTFTRGSHSYSIDGPRALTRSLNEGTLKV